MNSLFIINENLTNGYVPYILDIMSIIAIICGIFVIVSKNPIVSVLFLIGLFASISFYLILIGLAFIGLSYLIVYIGAVSMLFLFILMLINIRVSELQSETSNSLPLAIIITIFFNYAIFEILPYSITKSNNLSTLNTTFYNILLNNDYNDFISLNLKNSDLFLVTSKI
jgi:NADH-ubiquinone oxidoreductase chain 6